MQNTFTTKQVLKQLKADLIGKDSYRGFTLTYSWLANQFGHFGLGFVPTVIIYCLLHFKGYTYTAYTVAGCVALGWFLFELYNFLGPLLKKKIATGSRIYIPSDKSYVFQPAWGNVAFDTFTDVTFFALGAFSAACSLAVVWYAVLFVILIVLLYPVKYWFATKMLLQYARFPTQFRLSQWNRAIDVQHINTVKQFLANTTPSTSNHLLIFGDKQTGKSLLSVALGTELSIKRVTTSYYTAIKWFSTLSLGKDEIIADENIDLWTWRDARLLILDDINSAYSGVVNTLHPQQLQQVIVNGYMGSINQKQLVQKNVIWVMGSKEMYAQMETDCWQKMLVQLGIAASNISEIYL